VCFSPYAGPCLYESGLIPKKLGYREDAQLLDYGIGLTNIVPRTTRAADQLSKYIETRFIVLLFVICYPKRGCIQGGLSVLF